GQPAANRASSSGLIRDGGSSPRSFSSAGSEITTPDPGVDGRRTEAAGQQGRPPHDGRHGHRRWRCERHAHRRRARTLRRPRARHPRRHHRRLRARRGLLHRGAAAPPQRPRRPDELPPRGAGAPPRLARGPWRAGRPRGVPPAPALRPVPRRAARRRRLRRPHGGGPRARARAAVLALGNFPPELPAGWTALPPRLAWRTPWAARDEWPAPDAEVLLLGAGLTAVDVVLSLLARGHRGRIHLLSRRGLLPMTHPPRMLPPVPLGERPARLRGLVRLFREASARDDARAVLDTLRPELGALWL